VITTSAAMSHGNRQPLRGELFAMDEHADTRRDKK
jgi:hypothetical protein